MKLEKQIAETGKRIFQEYLASQHPGANVQRLGKYLVARNQLIWVMTKRMVQWTPRKGLKEWVTGVNLDKLERYKNVIAQHGLPGYIVFVDVSTKTIYGQLLDVLETPYKTMGVSYPVEYGSAAAGKLRYWHHTQMQHVAKLTPEQVEELTRLVILNKTAPGQQTLFI